jgi:glycerol-3-phosphate O-acyltransferase
LNHALPEATPMNDPITLPLWLFLILVGITALALLDKMLIPSVRWFLRRKVDRLIDEISHRLDIQIRPFQLTKRQVLIDRLVNDPKVIAAIDREAREQSIPRETLRAEVSVYAREIVPSFNAYLYFRIGYWLAKKIARLMYWVHVGVIEEERLAEIDPESAVVFVMNHRSNMDYILVAFLVAERTTLSYAVGEWAKIWPLQTLIRSMGAYFVRRNSKNSLYRQVLRRYVHMATREGVCQAVFPEGGLSRDGYLHDPKYGIFDYMLRGFDPEMDRDITFIPIGINYDRVLEDRSLLRSLDPLAEKRSTWFVLKTSLGFLAKSVLLMLTSRWRRFGHACVTFGPPLSMRQHCRRYGLNFNRVDKRVRFEAVEQISRQLMDAVRWVIPVLPVPLVATIFVRSPDSRFSASDIEHHTHRLIAEIQNRHAPVFVSTYSRVENIITALDMLTIRHLVIETDGLYRADPEMLDILSYYANAIAHWVRPHIS